VYVIPIDMHAGIHIGIGVNYIYTTWAVVGGQCYQSVGVFFLPVKKVQSGPLSQPSSRTAMSKKGH